MKVNATVVYINIMNKTVYLPVILSKYYTKLKIEKMLESEGNTVIGFQYTTI